MTILLIAGLAFVAISAALGTRAMAFGRMRAADRLRSIEMYGFPRIVEQVADAERRRPVTERLAERVGVLAQDRLPRVDLASTRRTLESAGVYRVTAEAFVGYQVLACAILLPLFLASALQSPTVFSIVALPLSLAVAWRLPPIVLERRGNARKAAIDRELPELIDLLIVGIEAGLGLSAAQQLIAGRLQGPLGNEMRLMLHQQSMGLTNDQSLGNLLERCDTVFVASFVRSLQQGERLGVSIGMTLRNLAVEMRTRRRQLAEERAQKAPVKMLFPLVFLILPVMFIVLLGPAVLTFKDVFTGA